MDQWLDFSWVGQFSVLTMSTLLLACLAAVALLLHKLPSGRWLGFLLLVDLILIAIRTTSTDLWVLSAVAQSVIASFLYFRAFFYQKKRTPIVHYLSIAAVWGVSMMLASTDVLRIVFLIGIVLVYAYQIGMLLLSESKTRGFSFFLAPGPRIAWLRNFVVLKVCFLALAFLSLPSALSSLSLLLLLAFVLYQLFQESSFLAPLPLQNKYKKSPLTPEITSSTLEKLENVMGVEQFYLRDDASLSKLAALLGLSNHHLSHLLNESVGMSFQDLIARYRIREACLLLKAEENDQVKIENIAAQIGYNSKSAFNTAFKRRTGMTPSEYRQRKGVRIYGEERLSQDTIPSNRTSAVDLNHVFSLKLNRDMIQHFFKLFGRNVKRNGLFSFLNVLGLTVAFTCSILIYLFLDDELSYDQDLPGSDRVYRIAWMSENPQTRTPHPMAQALVQDFPEVESAVSLSPWYGPGLSKELVRVKNVEDNIFFEEPDFFFVDSTFLDVFPVEWVEGDQEALGKPFSLVITEPMAQKYFGDSSAVGKFLELNDRSIAVSAVVKPMPKNSHFHFNALIPYITLKQLNPDDSWMTWADFGHFNYVKLQRDADPEVVEGKIPDWVGIYLDWWDERKESYAAAGTKFALQPVRDIHLTSHLRWELEDNGNILYVYILSGTLIFLLLIASINYMNLTTAKSIERAKEVGVRKTLGAVSGRLSIQFYAESVLFCFIAMVFSVGLVAMFLANFNSLSGKEFTISMVLNEVLLLKAFGLAALIGMLAGFYPAMALSAFKPTEVLKGKLTTSSRGVRLRSGLVVVQFAVSAVLISGSLMINRQIGFMKDKDLGFDQDAVISLRIPTSITEDGINQSKVEAVQIQIEQLSGVLETSVVSNLPGGHFNQHPYYAASVPENRVDASEAMVGYDFEKVLGLEIVEGRSFERSFAGDSGTYFVINEIAAEQLNLERPVGERLVWVDNDKEVEGIIIGVLNDFHYRSLHEDIQPLVLVNYPPGAGHIIIKTEGTEFSRIIDEIEPIYAQLGNEVFEYEFLDQQLAELYTQEEQTLSIFSVFSSIALLLASLGLLGMAIAVLNQRIKEVGMRKILGATSMQIMMMILGQFARLVAVALVVGWPLSYLLMRGWLTEFSYRAPFGVMPFVWAGVILMVVASVSVLSAVMKITFANPADSLRYE